MAEVNVQPFLIGTGWIAVKDGNDSARDMRRRHYSYRPYADGRKPLLILGPGEKLLLLHACARAVFAWRKFIDDCPGQHGINCAIFRNEGAGLSSELIRSADAIADERWPGERHYTYVDPNEVRSGLPGYCFLRAGWRYCGWSASGKRIIERRPK